MGDFADAQSNASFIFQANPFDSATSRSLGVGRIGIPSYEIPKQVGANAPGLRSSV
jgi:hypothetical protein